MPNTIGDADIGPMISAFGVPVVLGAVHTFGIKDEIDQEALHGIGSSMGVRRVNVRVKTAEVIAVIALESSITVDGEAFKIVNFERLSDGKTMRIDCAKVAR